MLMTIITYALAFIVTLLVLVSIHEFGHFWVARKMGVKVLRFSIGMGKPLWSKTGKDGVEYVIAPIPLGGYVKMLGDQPDDPVSEEEKHQAFNHASIPARAAIVLAGPIFNLLLAIILLWVVNLVGTNGLMPLVGEVTSGSVAEQAGFQQGDEILMVGDKKTPTWANVHYYLLTQAINSDQILLKVRQKDGREVSHQLPIAFILKYEKNKRLLKSLGLQPFIPKLPIILAEVVAGKPAALGGLKAGDKIITINQQPLQYWQEFSTFIEKHADQPLTMKIERKGQTLTKVITPQSQLIDGKKVVRIGVRAKVDKDLWKPYQRKVQYGIIDAFHKSIDQTIDFSLMVVNGIKKMLNKELSVMNMGGPVTIIQAAGQNAQSGLVSFIFFLAMFSVNLGVINLLPIPVLDGGHLLFLVIEAIKGRPLSEKMMEYTQMFGMMIIASLMLLVFSVDIIRLIE